MKTGALQCYSQANLGAVLGKTTRQDRGLGTNLLAVRVPRVCVLPIDTRVQREGGALNGFLSETIFAHPRYKGSLFPYTQGGWAGHFNCVLDRVVYFDSVVQDLTQLSMLAVTCATRVDDAAANYLFETTSK